MISDDAAVTWKATIPSMVPDHICISLLPDEPPKIPPLVEAVFLSEKDVRNDRSCKLLVSSSSTPMMVAFIKDAAVVKAFRKGNLPGQYG
jgi:hypothetical protein